MKLAFHFVQIPNPSYMLYQYPIIIIIIIIVRLYLYYINI
nr:MAG TPA: hypothetical protein [Caudoviricetes sp.]